jgi:hypothetical protein
VGASRQRVIALVAAGVLAGGAAGVAVSQLGVATASSSPSPAPGVPAPDFRGGPMGGPGRLGLLGAAGRVLHGEATIEKAGGGTQVVRFQHGTISAIAGSTVTVKSTDGFTSTFTVDRTSRITLKGTDGTLSRLKKGDEVRVFGVASGSSTVARLLLDGVPTGRMLGDGMRGRMGRQLFHRFMHRMPAPAPSAQSG